jgi:hypothetical protein
VIELAGTGIERREVVRHYEAAAAGAETAIENMLADLARAAAVSP